MELNNTLLFGVDTTIAGLLAIIVVFVILAVIVVLQLKILKLLSKQPKILEEVKAGKPEADVKNQQSVYTPAGNGATKGEATLLGIEDDEYAAVIIAAVSSAANIPLSALKIRSISRIDNTLEINSK